MADVTLATLQTHMTARFDGSPFWTADEARRCLNEALRAWNSLTGQWRTRAVLPAVNGPWIALPAALTYPARVDFDDRPMRKASVLQMDLGRPHWEGEKTTDGGEVPAKPVVWAPFGLYKIAIWPSDPTPDHCLVVDGLAQTPVLTSSADVIQLGEEDLSLLTGYALHAAAFKVGGPVFEATLPLYYAFLKGAGKQNVSLWASKKFRAAAGVDETLGQATRQPQPEASNA